ncbi:polyamine ABC transporter substrate-binding protein [Rhodospirillaceae bacterium SYSU D60014]|uniref:ABC transporter substrate-binding protein n=1 Tax=Virgifigura deserti TaxID=2268457 RepID=UPI000E66EA9C
MKRLTSRNFSRRRFLGGAAAIGVTVSALPRKGWAQSKQVNVYNWDTYIGETTLETFTENTGIEVQYDLYANNEELLAKLQAGNPGYDLIFPSDWAVENMALRNMIMPLDHSKLTNLDNIDPNFRNLSFDPGMAHSVPYMWGTMGIGYRATAVDETPDSWGVLLDSDKYSGRIALLEDQRSVLGIALKYLGYSMNSTNPDEIAEARDLLIAQKRHIKAFAPDSGQDMLIAGDADLVMEWNGDIMQVMTEDDELSYIVPKEGGMVWTDNMCIPTGAPNVENAYAFIDHILDAEVNAEIANTIQFATANKAARQYINEADLKNPAIYPPDEAIAQSESLKEIGDALRLYSEAWTAVQAA